MTPTCLIGEADPFIARLLNRFAEESGLQAFQAAQGEDLLELAREHQPDVIILEVELPGKLRGWEAVQSLQAEPATAGIPVISCSWTNSRAVKDRIAAVCAHLQKPELHYPDFLEALQQAGIGLENQTKGPRQPGELIPHE
jgi:two-component system cell cycle response regulator DivK